jgi:outer membrane immunogenic protein
MVNLTARAGFLATPSTLIYGKAGINWSSIDFQVNNIIDINGGTCGPIGSTHPGYNAVNKWTPGVTAGLGIEQRVFDRITLFAEYDVVESSGTTTNLFSGGTGLNPGCTPNFQAKTTLKPLNIVKVGLNYQFH